MRPAQQNQYVGRVPLRVGQISTSAHRNLHFNAAWREKSLCSYCLCPVPCKTRAPCEARTHDLQIMRLTRCLLRQRGYTIVYSCSHRTTHCYNAITLDLHYIITLLLHQSGSGWDVISFYLNLILASICHRDESRGIRSNGRALA